MAIKHITGVPGTGKTYFAINDVILRHYKFSSAHVEWQFDEDKTKKPVLIYTNIENLKLKHINIDTYCASANIDIYTFFTVDYWEKHIDFENNQIVIILDEAQRYFPSSYRLRGTPAPGENPLYWFQYHRHFGADVYVITQTYDSICKHIVQLAEYEIHAVTRVYRIGNNFRYVYRTGLGPDNIVLRKSISYDKRVGMLYQSYMADSDDSKRPNPMRKYLIIGFVLTFCVLSGLYHVLTTGFGPKPKKTSTVVSADTTPHRVRDERGRASVSTPPEQHVHPEPELQVPAKSGISLPERHLIVSCGGMWVRNELIAIEFYGDLVPVRDFGFAFFPDRDRRRVNVSLPESLVEDIQLARHNRLYQDDDNRWHDIEQTEEYTPDRDYSNYSEGQLVKNRAKQQETSRRERIEQRVNKDLPF